MLRTQHSGWCQDPCAKKLSFPQVICRTVPVATPRLIYHLTGALLQWRAQENLVECEKFNSFRKGQTRKVMSPPQLMNGEAREGAAGSKLGVCNHTFQMHKHSYVYTKSNSWMLDSFCVKYNQMLGRSHSSLVCLGSKVCLECSDVPHCTGKLWTARCSSTQLLRELLTWQHRLLPLCKVSS